MVATVIKEKRETFCRGKGRLCIQPRERRKACEPPLAEVLRNRELSMLLSSEVWWAAHALPLSAKGLLRLAGRSSTSPGSVRPVGQQSCLRRLRSRNRNFVQPCNCS